MCVAYLACGVAACSDDEVVTPLPVPAVEDACANIEAEFKGSFDALASLVAVETHRAENFANEDTLVANMQTIYDDLKAQVEKFNEGQKTHKLVPWEWKKESGSTTDPRYWWVFGFRLGSGPRKVALSTHLDTVFFGDTTLWEPFKLTRTTGKTNHGGEQEFWTGRGAIDDKGPALATFQVLKAVARAYDGNPLLNDVTVEIIFDTSEETSLSMEHYVAENPQDEPDLAVIFDAFWSIRAEKGIERPVFTLPREAPITTGVWIESLNTPSGPTNQIPDRAEAILRSDSQEQLADLAQRIDGMYTAHPFDDPSYRRAKLTVDTSGMPAELKLITEVAGAQHGSAPQENRAGGANPLISLTNFLGGLAGTSDLADNDVARMCKFIRSTWGTKVFGEGHPEQLERHDDVFTEGNGTTYAVTRFYTEAQPGAITVNVDIRYAIGHHAEPWDGESEGSLCGDQSTFSGIFTELVDEFNATTGGPPVSFTTATRAIPDVRRTDGPAFSAISSAYQEVMGKPSPSLAIGGGTDAKGHVKFVAAGALFDAELGPPVNYHGLNEAAPVSDLAQSSSILCSLIDHEIQHAKDEHPESVANACGSASRARPRSAVSADRDLR
jgi:succinyl-diaminopimelate desuccinylase